MTSILISNAAKIVYLVEPILNQFDYLINFNDNVENLTKRVEKLEAINLKVKQLIEIAKRNAEDIKLDVERWLSNVDEIIQCLKIKVHFQYIPLLKFLDIPGWMPMKCCQRKELSCLFIYF